MANIEIPKTSTETINAIIAADKFLNKDITLIASSVLVTDSSSKITTTSTPSSKLAHLNSVNADIQSQLNAKASSVDPIFTGTVTIPETPVNATDAASKGYVDGKSLKAYASIYLSDGSTAQSIPTGDTYTKIEAYTTNGLSANCTPDAANDKITITQNGVYSVAYTASYRSGTNNVTFSGAIFLDGVEQGNIHSGGQMGLAGAMRSTACSGFINVTDAPKDIDVRIRHDQGGDIAITHVYANLNIEKIG